MSFLRPSRSRSRLRTIESGTSAIPGAFAAPRVVPAGGPRATLVALRGPAAAALGGREERDPDRGERDRNEEPHQPTGIEEVREDAAEEACCDPDERRREQADLLT